MRLTKTHALVIGVGHYSHGNFADLPATVKDAEAIAALLKDPNRCAYPPDQVELLTGEHATGDALRSALKKLKHTTDADATVFFYFSGHGGQAYEQGQWHTYLSTFAVDI
jgi:uncharacterized caspase-like protein